MGVEHDEGRLRAPASLDESPPRAAPFPSRFSFDEDHAGAGGEGLEDRVQAPHRDALAEDATDVTAPKSDGSDCPHWTVTTERPTRIASPPTRRTSLTCTPFTACRSWNRGRRTEGAPPSAREMRVGARPRGRRAEGHKPDSSRGRRGCGETRSRE